MGMNADECGDGRSRARSRRPAGVAQVFRFEDSTAPPRDRLAAGQIGRPIFARSEFSYPAELIPKWLTISPGGWRPTPMWACIASMRSLILQDEVVRVTARGMWMQPPRRRSGCHSVI